MSNKYQELLDHLIEAKKATGWAQSPTARQDNLYILAEFGKWIVNNADWILSAMELDDEEAMKAHHKWQEFIKQCEDIESYVISHPSRLDDIIPPDIILGLLKKNKSWTSSKFGPRSLPVKISQKHLNDTRIGNMIIKRFPFITPSVMLKRILFVREFLSNI